MDNFLVFVQHYGGGIAVFAIIIGAIAYVFFGVRRDGVELGMKALKTALEQNTGDLKTVREELESVQGELSNVKTELANVRVEMQASRREVSALRRYAQALRAMIKRELPNANLPPAPDGIEL